MNQEWKNLLERVLLRGDVVSPRGLRTKERQHQTLTVDLRRPVLTLPARKLSYSGAAAEAYWILTGDNRLDGIAPWLPKMADFSDDGVTLAGAYGPRIAGQLPYVCGKLEGDPDTRQATLTIWTPNPGPSKDYPCTVAMDFKIRNRELQMHVFMRSSDVWLGVPYDVFSFAMLAHLICCRLNRGQCVEPVVPGWLYLTASSSHLYERNWLDALGALGDDQSDYSQYQTPDFMYQEEQRLLARLEHLRSSKAGDRLRWWESGQ